MTNTTVKRYERGCTGQPCCADYYRFRRNTLLEKNGVYVVVSTVGNMRSHGDALPTPAGVGHYYETMAFMSDTEDARYHDADCSKELPTLYNCFIAGADLDNEANCMHEAAVSNMMDRMDSCDEVGAENVFEFLTSNLNV